MSLSETSIKDLVGIVVVIVVGLAFLGVIVNATEPPLVPQTIHGTEVLRPISNVPPQLPDTWTDWGVKGCTSGNHAECVDDISQDGNDTYIWKNYTNSANEDQHMLGNLSRTDITIVSVIAWSWARINATWVEGNAYSFGLSYPHLAGYGDCAPFWTGELSLAFINYSVVVPSCTGAWTALFINNMTISQKGFSTNYNMTVTSEGVTVSYMYTEYVQETGTDWNLLALVPLFVILLLILIVVAWWYNSDI